MMLAKILKPFLPKVKEMVTDQQLLEIYDSYVDAKSKEELEAFSQAVLDRIAAMKEKYVTEK